MALLCRDGCISWRPPAYSLLCERCTILRYTHWSLSFAHKLTRVSKSLTALFGMRHLTYGTTFLHLFAFLVSRPPQSTLLHCQAPTLLLNRWLACLTWSSILVLKLTFSPVPFPRNLPLSLSNGLISRFFYPARVRKSLSLKILVSAAD